MFEIIKIKIYVVYTYIQRTHTVTFMLYCWESNGEGCSLLKTGRGLMGLDLTGDPGRDVLRTVPGDWYPIKISRCCQPAEKNFVAERSVLFEVKAKTSHGFLLPASLTPARLAALLVVSYDQAVHIVFAILDLRSTGKIPSTNSLRDVGPSGRSLSYFVRSNSVLSS